MRIFAVIPTHNRPDELRDLLATIPHFVSVLVIDNASEPPVAKPSGAGLSGDLFDQFLGRRIQVMRDDEQPPNLSRLWNLGLQWAERMFREECKTPADRELVDDWAVAVLNDDVLLSPGLLVTLASKLFTHNVDIAFPGPVDSRDYVNREMPFPGVMLRMTGWCFMVRGSSGLRADESMRWWFGDDDLQAQAVVHGRGSVRVGLRDFEVAGLQHRHPDAQTTGVLREQTEVDSKTFVEKWGQHPWLPQQDPKPTDEIESLSGTLDADGNRAEI